VPPRLVIRPHELRNRRLKAVLSRRQLAEASSLSRRRIEQLEGGHDLGVRPDTVQRLARALDCRPEELTEAVEA
jgi:transcriptional regulator with XRE-family HTH domain